MQKARLSAGLFVFPSHFSPLFAHRHLPLRATRDRHAQAFKNAATR